MAKVLFYISSLNRGGAERVLLSVIEFCKESHDVVLLTDVYADDEYILPNGVNRICLADDKADNKNRIWAALRRLLAIRKVCKKEKSELAIAFMSSVGVRLMAATLLMPIKTAIAIRNNPLDELQSGVRRKLLLNALKRTDGVIFQMNSQKELFDKKIQNKSTVIFNPISEQFCNVNRSAVNKNKIVTVGRLFDYKNQSLLIDSFCKIKKIFPDIKLYIYGEGDYRKELEKKIKQLCLEKDVFLPGAVSNIVNEIIDAQLFVLPSDTEGMPNTLIEAMVLGIPVVSTDCPCGGPRTLIEDGKNGLLVPVRDQQALTQAMIKVLEDEKFAEQIGANARNIITLCDRSVIRKKWIDYVDCLLSGK